jgi:Site-specific recombinase XerD
MKLEKDSLFDFIHGYLKIYLPRQRKVSQNTIRSYREAIELLVDFIKDKNKIPLGDVTFEMIKFETLSEYLDYLENERGCSISTRNSRLAAIRAFFKYVSEKDVTTVSIFKEIKKIPVKNPDTVQCVKYMSEDAIAAIISQPDTSKLKGLRDRFFMMLLYDTGARVQELIDIKLQDFRYGKTPTLTLWGKPNKKQRTVPLMEKTVLHLHQYLDVFHQNRKNENNPLFYVITHGQMHQLSDDCIRKFLKRYGESARTSCIEVPENIHPHLFRHSRAMHLYQHGMDLTLVSQWLGHVNLETTLIYSHADTEHKRRAIEKATSNGEDTPINISPKRFTINDEIELKRLTGLI